MTTKSIDLIKEIKKILIIEKMSLENNITLYEILEKIIAKKQDKKSITKKEYNSLVELGCPNFEILTDAFCEEYYDDCPNMTCNECWKEYIEALITTCENSNLEIKKTADIISNKRFSVIDFNKESCD